MKKCVQVLGARDHLQIHTMVHVNWQLESCMQGFIAEKWAIVECVECGVHVSHDDTTFYLTFACPNCKQRALAYDICWYVWMCGYMGNHLLVESYMQVCRDHMMMPHLAWYLCVWIRWQHEIQYASLQRSHDDTIPCLVLVCDARGWEGIINDMIGQEDGRYLFSRGKEVGRDMKLAKVSNCLPPCVHGAF